MRYRVCEIKDLHWEEMYETLYHAWRAIITKELFWRSAIRLFRLMNSIRNSHCIVLLSQGPFMAVERHNAMSVRPTWPNCYRLLSHSYSRLIFFVTEEVEIFVPSVPHISALMMMTYFVSANWCDKPHNQNAKKTYIGYILCMNACLCIYSESILNRTTLA